MPKLLVTPVTWKKFQEKGVTVISAPQIGVPLVVGGFDSREEADDAYHSLTTARVDNTDFDLSYEVVKLY